MKILLFAILSWLFANSEVLAQDKIYPNRTITIIVPFAPGGGSDILSRTVAAQLKEILKVPVVVENRPGGGGVTGALAANRAPADGYTLLLAGMTTLSANAALYKKLDKKLPYDPADFLPLAMAATTPFVLVVNPSIPVSSVYEFIQFAKKTSEPMAYATTGPGAPHHLFMELFSSLTGVKMSAVPYKGTAPGLADVIGGHIPAMLSDLGPVIPHIQSGRVKPLGVSTAYRVSAIRSVPPINDVVTGFDVSSWQVFTVPSATQPSVVNALHLALKNLLAQEAISETLVGLGMVPMPTGTIDEMKAFIASESLRWGETIDKMGIRGLL